MHTHLFLTIDLTYVKPNVIWKGREEEEEGGKEGEKNALLPHLLGKYLHYH